MNLGKQISTKSNNTRALEKVAQCLSRSKRALLLNYQLPESFRAYLTTSGHMCDLHVASHFRLKASLIKS